MRESWPPPIIATTPYLLVAVLVVLPILPRLHLLGAPSKGHIRIQLLVLLPTLRTNPRNETATAMRMDLDDSCFVLVL